MAARLPRCHTPKAAEFVNLIFYPAPLQATRCSNRPRKLVPISRHVKFKSINERLFYIKSRVDKVQWRAFLQNEGIQGPLNDIKIQTNRWYKNTCRSCLPHPPWKQIIPYDELSPQKRSSQTYHYPTLQNGQDGWPDGTIGQSCP